MEETEMGSDDWFVENSDDIDLVSDAKGLEYGGAVFDKHKLKISYSSAIDSVTKQACQIWSIWRILINYSLIIQKWNVILHWSTIQMLDNVVFIE